MFQFIRFNHRRQVWLSAARQTSQRSRHFATASEKERTIFSGIQPTGVPHLGNYLGAIAQWVQMQRDAAADSRLYFSIVDLHSLTSRTQTPAERKLSRTQTLAVLLAAGLDPGQSIIFHQSQVPQHAELHWILSCDASVGALARMPTWKEKMADSLSSSRDSGSVDDAERLLLSSGRDHEERLKLGLFSYPVLQAADVLLYDTTHVPVGSDQLVHIEFARAAANTFNHVFGQKNRDILVPPQAVLGPARRIMSLTEPTKKMSKSAANARSRVLITDSDEEIKKKFKSALTDSIDRITFDTDARPGVSNLLEMIALLESKAHNIDRPPGEVAKDFDAMTVTGSIMRVLKERVADLVCAELAPVRERFKSLMAHPLQLDEVAERGKIQATKHAEITMQRVREAIGLS